MDRIKNKYLRALKFRTIPLKTMGVIAVGLFFIMGLSANAAVQPNPVDSAKPSTHRLGLNSIEKMAPSGGYTVYVLKSGTWQEAGAFKCDKFLREQSLDLSPFLTSNEPVQIRLVEKGGGAAHIDAILLGGKPPAKVKGNQEALWLKKISKRDLDVMDAFGKTLEFAFSATEKDKTLRLTARIEPETISKTPFQFPTKNLFREIDKNARFYTYKLGSQKTGSTPNAGSEEKEQPFFKEYCSTGSGHPSGFTYGWVRNDDKNLYVKIDFTPDNTMDGDKDYASLHVKTAEGLKTFKVSESVSKWGKPDFTSTDKAAYEHKVYNIQIPLKELNVKNADKGKELLLAFSAYGTAYPKGYEPVTAYDSADNYYLVVYEESPWSGLSRIWAQVIDPDGTPVAPAQQIFQGVQFNGNIAIAYDSVNDGFLVVWEHYPGVGNPLDTNANIYGMWITVDVSGSIGGGTQFVVNCDPETGNQWNPAVAYDSANQNFLVVWEDERNSGTPDGTDIYGQIVQSCSDGPDSCAPYFGNRCNKIDPGELDKLISHGDLPYYRYGDQLNPAVAYDSVNGEYLVVWEYYLDYDNHDNGDPTEYDVYPTIFGQFVDDTGDHIYGQSFTVSTDWYTVDPITIYEHYQYHPSIGYDSHNEKFLITWEDYRNIATTGIDIYAQRVYHIPSPLYPWLIWSGAATVGGEDDVTILALRDDVVISNAADDQLHPALTYDSTYFDFLVVWEDYRDGASTGYDIYGQPIYANGNTSYPALGQSVEIYTLGDNQTHPSITFNPDNQSFLSAFETDPGTANDIDFVIFSLEDGDNDGMPFWWETLHGLDPYADDSLEDPDGDGMTNLQEYLNEPQTNPNENDLDKDTDGVLDINDNCPNFRNTMKLYVGDSRGDCASAQNLVVSGYWQQDYDCDGIGNECDDDADNDGYLDSDQPNGSDCDDLNENIYPGYPSDEVCPYTGISDTPKNKDEVPDDGDGVPEIEDNCPGDPDNLNPKVAYKTGDSMGDCATDPENPLVDDDGNWQPDYDCDTIGDACDNCTKFANSNQVIPVWYKDGDNDEYSNQETLSTETQPECNRPPEYKLEGELLSLAFDCDDSDASIHPWAEEPPGSVIDNNCDGTVAGVGDYTIAIETMSPVDYDSWKPTPGDNLTVGFKVLRPDGVTEITTELNDYNERLITGNFQFSLAELSPPLQTNPTNYRGKYHNDPREAGVETPPDDFIHNLPQLTGNSIQLTCKDYGAWIAVHVEVLLERDGKVIPLQRDFTFPKDSDRDGLGDFWEDLYGDLNPNDDLEHDGVDVTGEYRGWWWGETMWVAAHSPDVPYDYDTPAYVPVGGPQGTVSHFRGNPKERDLFIKFEGFDAEWPFAIGEAFHNIPPPNRVTVHALGGTKVETLPTESDTYNIDVVTVTLMTDTYNPIPSDAQYAQSSHIVKRDKRDWTYLVVANGSYGNDSVYGNAKLYKPTIQNFLGVDIGEDKADKPYHDYTTLAVGGSKKTQADWICNNGDEYLPDWYDCKGGTGSGELDGLDLTEDIDDNGLINAGQDKSGNGRLDGDFPVLNVYDNRAYEDREDINYIGPDIDGDGHDDEFDYRFELSPFNVDNDNETELPIAVTAGEINPLYENTRAQAIKMYVTHEVGHNVGVTLHTGVATDAMFEETNNLVRDGRLGADAENLVRIHSKYAQ